MQSILLSHRSEGHGFNRAAKAALKVLSTLPKAEVKPEGRND
jgi:hypothetical protein